MGLYWVPGRAGRRGNEIADGLARGGSALKFLGTEPPLGVSRRDLENRLGLTFVNQHGAQWRGFGDTQRQAQDIISGPSQGIRAKFFTFNRTQSSGLLTGHNTLTRHPYLLGLLDSHLYWKCGVRKETSAHVLCECEALASLRHVYLDWLLSLGAGGYEEFNL